MGKKYREIEQRRAKQILLCMKHKHSIAYLSRKNRVIHLDKCFGCGLPISKWPKEPDWESYRAFMEFRNFD